MTLVEKLGTLDGLYYLWWPIHDGYLARWWAGAGQEVDLLRSGLFRYSDIDLSGIHTGYIPIEAEAAASWSIDVDDRLWVPVCRILEARESLARELAVFGARSLARIRMSFEAPDVLFTSPPCVGMSRLIPSTTSHSIEDPGRDQPEGMEEPCATTG